MTPWTRRQFGKSAAAAWIGTAVGGARVFGANEKVRVGFIGVGNRGDQVLDAFLAHPDMEVVAVCDLDARYLDEWDGRREQFTNHARANAALTYKYRSPHTLPQHAAPARSSQ